MTYINSEAIGKTNEQNEFFCNLLLMPFEIEMNNKLDTFFNLLKLYEKTEQKYLILRMNQKIDKLFTKENNIDMKYILYSFLNTSDILLNDYKNYFYALKYINKCIIIINYPINKISDNDSTKIKNKY